MATSAKRQKSVKPESMGRGRKVLDTNIYSGRVAARCRELREAKGWSVEQLVERLNDAGYEVTAPGIYHWENGGAAIPLNAVPYLAEIFGKSIAAFLPKS